MREYSYLEKAILNMAICPRYYPEDISYLNLKSNFKDLTEWYIPMTCFCDIPLHQISYHAEGNSVSSIDQGYGKFSIAFHKEFGIRKGIQPIHYLNENSAHVEELVNAMHLLLNQVNTAAGINEVLTNFIFEYIRIRAEEINKIYTNSIPQTRNGVLEFNVEDVRYIFVETVQHRERLIRFIRGKRKGKRLSSQEKDILISKIMVYDELKEDW